MLLKFKKLIVEFLMFFLESLEFSIALYRDIKTIYLAN